MNAPLKHLHKSRKESWLSFIQLCPPAIRLVAPQHVISKNPLSHLFEKNIRHQCSLRHWLQIGCSLGDDLLGCKIGRSAKCMECLPASQSCRRNDDKTKNNSLFVRKFFSHSNLVALKNMFRSPFYQ